MVLAGHKIENIVSRMVPLLSLVIVNYNQGKYFEDCLRKTTLQTFKDFELIVIDDCSADNSVEMIRSLLKQYSVKANFIVNKKNQGICANLNMALKIAKGKYFSFIASDDWVEERCYEQMVKTFESAGEKVGLVYGDCHIVSEQKELLYPSYIQYFRPDLKQPPSGNVFHQLLNGNFLPAMVTTTRTSVLLQLNGFDESLKVEDFDMFLRIARDYHFLFVPGAGAAYRILPNSLIRRIGARKYEDWVEMYFKHIDADKQSQDIIRQKLKDCCEFLYYTDSEKFQYYVRKCRYYINPGWKIKLLLLLSYAGLKGSTLKKWSDQLQRRKNN